MVSPIMNPARIIRLEIHGSKTMRWLKYREGHCMSSDFMAFDIEATSQKTRIIESTVSRIQGSRGAAQLGAALRDGQKLYSLLVEDMRTANKSDVPIGKAETSADTGLKRVIRTLEKEIDAGTERLRTLS